MQAGPPCWFSWLTHLAATHQQFATCPNDLVTVRQVCECLRCPFDLSQEASLQCTHDEGDGCWNWIAGLAVRDRHVGVGLGPSPCIQGSCSVLQHICSTTLTAVDCLRLSVILLRCAASRYLRVDANYCPACDMHCLATATAAVALAEVLTTTVSALTLTNLWLVPSPALHPPAATCVRSTDVACCGAYPLTRVELINQWHLHVLDTFKA